MTDMTIKKQQNAELSTYLKASNNRAVIEAKRKGAPESSSNYKVFEVIVVTGSRRISFQKNSSGQLYSLSLHVIDRKCDIPKNRLE